MKRKIITDCRITGIHRESDFRVGGSTVCLDCGVKLTTCCEGTRS